MPDAPITPQDHAALDELRESLEAILPGLQRRLEQGQSVESVLRIAFIRGYMRGSLEAVNAMSAQHASAWRVTTALMRGDSHAQT